MNDSDKVHKNADNIVNIDRRKFLKSSATVGAGLTLCVYFPDVFSEESGPGKTIDSLVEGSFEPNAFVRIGTDNRIVVVIKHLEMGQGTFTGLSTLVAEELDADWAQIHPEYAPADGSRYNNLFWGPFQGTGGSSGIANSFEQMRKAGAAARQMLLTAAAEKWQVPINELTTSRGVVTHAGSSQRATYGELSQLAAAQTVPEEVTLKDPKDFIYIGKGVTRKDSGKTDGTAQFTQDVKLPGMLTALVAHPPQFGATVKSFDASEAKAIKGVTNVVQIPTGVAVLAKDFWSARKGRDALKIEWDDSEAFKLSSDEIMAQYKALAEQPGTIARQDGDADKALKDADEVLEATYEFPYLAHAAMEPMNCVVQIHDQDQDNKRCEIWNGAQLHTGDQYAVGAVLGIEHTQVTINSLYAGGSFGRRGNKDSDYVVEAANIAKSYSQAGGESVPIKMVWTREDDTQAGYYRPMYYHTLRAGLDKNGNLTGWQQRIVGQSIMKNTAFEAGMVKEGVDVTSVEGAANMPYEIPNFNLQLHSPEQGVPTLWWRAVGSTHTAFSAETFIDELANTAGKDPVDFRMEMLKDHPRHRGVLQLVKEKSGWGNDMPRGRGRGVAVHESFKSFVAQVAEVTVHDDGTYSVDRIVCAVDCGVAVNPDIIRAQMEGGIGFGLSPTLVSEITLEKGRVKQSNFHDYQVLRLNQMPEIEVYIVPSAEPPTGVGEPGTPVVAPAVANALSAVTGQRFNKLPLQLST